MSQVAVDLVEKIFGDLKGRSILLVGAGKMGTLSAKALRVLNVERVLVTNRSPERGQQLADQVGGVFRPWAELEQLLVEADVVIVSTGAPTFVLTADMVRAAKRKRRHRNLCLIDLAVPRNVDPACAELDDVFGYDVDDMQKVVSANHQARQGEAVSAEAIVEAEVIAFTRERETRAALPVLVTLRQRAEAIARAEAERTLAKAGDALDERARASIEAMAQAIVNKLLHLPTVRLKAAAATGESALAGAAAELFGLDQDPPAGRRGAAPNDAAGPAAPSPEEGRRVTIRIATRKSPLAKWQANHVADLLRALEPGLEVELHELMTRGDKILEVPLAQVGGKGLFVKEIEDALLAGDAQIAVHSMKDLPALLAPGLVVAAIPVREDPRDALCSPRWKTLDQLPQGARIGTSSLRRSAQLKAMRPDLRMEVVRGNVQTRLNKASEGLDAVVLAYAGLRRLGLAQHATQVLLAGADAAGGGAGGAGAGGPRRRRRPRWRGWRSSTTRRPATGSRPSAASWPASRAAARCPSPATPPSPTGRSTCGRWSPRSTARA